MSLSLVSLHWALVLVGVPDALAWVGPVVLEVGMAGTAFAATTQHKPLDDGTAPPTWKLWGIFTFLMALAQAANLGHAIVSVQPRLAAIPTVIPRPAL